MQVAQNSNQFAQNFSPMAQSSSSQNQNFNQQLRYTPNTTQNNVQSPQNRSLPTPTPMSISTANTYRPNSQNFRGNNSFQMHNIDENSEQTDHSEMQGDEDENFQELASENFLMDP